MKKIVVMSGKGGVGKSTVAANLAFSLSDDGDKVGIFDSDFHGPTIPKMLGVKGKKLTPDQEKIKPVSVNENLEVISMDFLLPDDDSAVIWRGPMKMKVINQMLGDVVWDGIDYMVVDLPPGTGDEPLSIAQQIPDIDGVIIVTTPQDVALQAVRKSINFAKKLNLKVLGVVENMDGLTCPNCGEMIKLFGEGGGERMSQELDVPYLGSIPIDPEIMKSGEEGKSFTETDSESTEAFREIINKIKDNMGMGD
ncbi:MAG: Mrp/NBP35 family ATP-binding protein [Candidatus Saliniplasma sp.]